MAIQFCDVFAYYNTEKLGTLGWILFFLLCSSVIIVLFYLVKRYLPLHV